jgi:hypothetical protein
MIKTQDWKEKQVLSWSKFQGVRCFNEKVKEGKYV